MNKTASIVVALVLVALIGGWVYYEKSQTVAPPATSAGSETTNPGSGAEAGVTLAEVAQHNSRSDCWAAIDGSVYDLTSWIPNHPGGEQAILQLCGTDGSSKFNGQHGNDSRAKGVLAGFKIGTLAP
jgi:cytochrome b involved in lipid metabolism